MKLRELGEDRLLAALLPHLPSNKLVVAAAGDDCAVVRGLSGGNLLLLKTDCVVEGIHFTPKTNAASVGWKAMARPLSDFAAMSGLPQFALITMIAPAGKTLGWIQQIYRGLGKAARAYDLAIVGGETSRTVGPAIISVSIAGKVESGRCVFRKGGKAGDDLFVTGRLGGSIRGGHLKFLPRIKESRWLTAHFPIHAMIDLSDGLGADLPRLAAASRLGFEIDKESLPRNRGCSIEQAISGGEDYELLFAISPKNRKRLEKMWRKKFPKLPLTRIGKLHPLSIEASPARTSHQPLRAGYVHFK